MGGLAIARHKPRMASRRPCSYTAPPPGSWSSSPSAPTCWSSNSSEGRVLVWGQGGQVRSQELGLTRLQSGGCGAGQACAGTACLGHTGDLPGLRQGGPLTWGAGVGEMMGQDEPCF